MHIIIPMAGRGTRLRPHTLTIPKPLIHVGGKPIIQRLVEDLHIAYSGTITEVSFIIGDFGAETEKSLLSIAESIGSKGKIYYQDKPLGVGHAISCASDSLTGPVMVAFADTLFKADFSFNEKEDGIIWVQKVEDPRQYGVVELDNTGTIVNLVEKPSEFISDLAIVGIYYFRDGDRLRAALKEVKDKDIKVKGEYQLTSALEIMKDTGTRFKPAQIEEWLDCGNQDAILNANERVLHFQKDDLELPESLETENATIIEPCAIGEGVKLRNCVIGPYVSVGDHALIENSVVKNSIIREGSQIRNAVLTDSMLGEKTIYTGSPKRLALGDYTQVKE
jgi:glucose-1-phosphate thymidylyltransferase